MKAKKKTAVKLKFNTTEYNAFLEIIRKVIDGEAPVHNVGILNEAQLDFLKKLQKIIQQ